MQFAVLVNLDRWLVRHAEDGSMDVVVRLSLQGGHKWDFCCHEDDPIIIGLMSALPGADLERNLPADGLIQLETRTGELTIPRP
jgi:hypothetical protein